LRLIIFIEPLVLCRLIAKPLRRLP
jgi:hypothetical protein